MKFLDGLSWRMGNLIARRNRAKFLRLIYSGGIIGPDKGSSAAASYDVVSFSGARDFPEQVLSILSFLKWAGQPLGWTVYSDGTHTDEMKQILSGLCPGVVVKSWSESRIRHNLLHGYSRDHAMGKRMIAYSSHSLIRPTLFIDSDIVFYPQSGRLILVAAADQRHWFLPDLGGNAMDSRLVRDLPKSIYYANGGCFLLKPDFNWEPVFTCLEKLNGNFEYFSDQTAFHVALQSQAAMPLDPRVFVLHCRDQFKFGMGFCRKSAALRHYVAMVRHKIWEPGWGWHLNQQVP